MQKLIFYLDDSGVLHKNSPQKHFVYGGYVFMGKEEENHAKRRYIQKVKQIKHSSGRTDELKAFNSSVKSKRKLYNVMKPFHSLSAYVNIKNVYSNILSDKKSIHRYKDYVVKILIKRQICDLISNDYINPNEDLELVINLDEQATSTNGIYDLKSSIYEELKLGIINWQYDKHFEPIITGELKVNVNYYVSSTNYLGQAADILANRIWTSYVCNNETLRIRDDHFSLPFP